MGKEAQKTHLSSIRLNSLSNGLQHDTSGHNQHAFEPNAILNFVHHAMVHPQLGDNPRSALLPVGDDLDSGNSLSSLGSISGDCLQIADEISVLNGPSISVILKHKFTNFPKQRRSTEYVSIGLVERRRRLAHIQSNVIRYPRIRCAANEGLARVLPRQRVGDLGGGAGSCGGNLEAVEREVGVGGAGFEGVKEDRGVRG